MRKLKKLAAGVVFAGTAFCVAPVIAVSPVAESVVFADEESITVEEGDAFEINTHLTTTGYNVHLADESADFSILSEEVFDGEAEGDYSLYVLCVIDTPGEHELIVEDENGEIVKNVSVNVTPLQVDGDPEGTGDESSDDDTGEQNDPGGEESADNTENADGDDTGEQGENETQENNGTENDQKPVSDETNVELVGFIPNPDGEISGTTESGGFNPGEVIKLKAVPEKGYIFRSWIVRNMEGRVVTADMNISEDGTFTLPDYPIRIAAEFEYILIHEIELLDVTEKLETGKPVAFTGRVKDNTDPRFFLLAEIWINEYDTKGITSNNATNEKLQKDEGLTLLEEVASGDKYNYSVMFMTTEGYEFADDVKLIYNGNEYTPTNDLEDLDGIGKETVVFNGFLSFGEQTNPKETKTTTKTVTRQETKTETVTQYVYKTYTYTTYQYVTRLVSTPITKRTANGTTMRTVATATGDTNYTAVWIALAIAAGGGVVSGILVGRRRKRNK